MHITPVFKLGNGELGKERITLSSCDVTNLTSIVENLGVWVAEHKSYVKTLF